MDEKFWVITKNRMGLLTAMLNALCGNAHISFEGDLSQHDFSVIPGSTSEETEILRRATFFPKQDFIVVPLEENTTQLILNQLMYSKNVWKDIIHIQIEKNGIIEFGAYDNFHPDCVVTGPRIQETLLEKLVSEGAVKSFAPVDKSRNG